MRVHLLGATEEVVDGESGLHRLNSVASRSPRQKRRRQPSTTPAATPKARIPPDRGDCSLPLPGNDRSTAPTGGGTTPPQSTTTRRTEDRRQDRPDAGGGSRVHPDRFRRPGSS